MRAVEIDGLTYTYPGASQPTLRNITLQIPQGDFLAVVGNNGCGKSTLCKVLNGLIPHFITGAMEGIIRVEGLDTRESDVGTLAQKVGYVYQDFENQIVRPTVLDDASCSCLNYAFPDYLERGRTALKQCGLEGREEEYVWQLSGGQTHLLALAGAVSLQPDILILDEPIAQLDPVHADRIYEVLRKLNEHHGKTIIVIEHHTEYIADYCKHVMLMEEFQNVLLSYRLRGNPPAHETVGGKVRYLIYQVKIIMQSFYPLMLNTAKRSRTTVEALELRGYRYAAVNKSVKKIKLASLKVTYNDGLFLSISFLVVAAAVLCSTLL